MPRTNCPSLFPFWNPFHLIYRRPLYCTDVIRHGDLISSARFSLFFFPPSPFLSHKRSTPFRNAQITTTRSNVVPTNYVWRNLLNTVDYKPGKLFRAHISRSDYGLLRTAERENITGDETKKKKKPYLRIRNVIINYNTNPYELFAVDKKRAAQWAIRNEHFFFFFITP